MFAKRAYRYTRRERNRVMDGHGRLTAMMVLQCVARNTCVYIGGYAELVTHTRRTNIDTRRMLVAAAAVVVAASAVAVAFYS